jgi:dTDP-4-dehydrorhamnose reductase
MRSEVAGGAGVGQGNGMDDQAAQSGEGASAGAGLRVVVTGTGGRLGGAVARRLRQRGHRVVAWDRKALDLTIPEQIDDHFGGARYDVVVNCAAATLLDWCEDHPEEAAMVNAEAPRRMAGHCRAQGARLVHVSTDYVYDGRSPGLRGEDDPVQPLGIYAATKAEGERLVLASGADAVVARVSWVFGPDRPAFPDQILRQAMRGEACAAVADKWSVPTYSHDLADMIGWLLGQPGINGILNLGSEGSCSWQEYGQATLDLAAELGLPLTVRQVEPLTLATMKSFRAARPLWTAMSTRRLRSLGFAPRPWREALGDYLRTYYAGAVELPEEI